MRKVQVRFYEELNDFLPENQRKRDVEYFFEQETAAADVLAAFGVPAAAVDLILINGESAALSSPVHDGDRIGVFPVFESFDIQPVAKVRPEPLRRTRFVTGPGLARLAFYLRLLGFDTRECGGCNRGELVEAAERGKRILLTRDPALLKEKKLSRGLCLREKRPRRQAIEILSRLDLLRAADPFGRCPSCNAGFGAAAPARKCPACSAAFRPGPKLRRLELLIDCILAREDAD